METPIKREVFKNQQVENKIYVKPPTKRIIIKEKPVLMDPLTPKRYNSASKRLSFSRRQSHQAHPLLVLVADDLPSGIEIKMGKLRDMFQIACFYSSKHSKQWPESDASYVFKNKSNSIEQALLDFGFTPDAKAAVHNAVVVLRSRKTEEGPDDKLSDLAACFENVVPLQITVPCG